MLISALEQHRHIVQFGEVFQKEREIKADHTRIWSEAPIEYLNSFIYKDYAKEIKAVGILIHYYHYQERNWKPVWKHLAASRIRVLH